MGHAPFAPSAAPRWINCPGSVALSRTVPEEPPGPAAMLGTRAHLYAERRLQRPHDYELEEKFTPQERKLAATFIAHCRHLVDFNHGARAVYEQRVTILDECWGTADAIIWTPHNRTLHVVDLKTGRWPVAPDSHQLAIYAAGALKMWPKAETVKTHIVQPQLHKLPLVREWEPFEVMAVKLMASNAVDRAKAGGDNLRPGPWCQWCPARSICPKLTSDLVALMDEQPDIGNIADDDNDL